MKKTDIAHTSLRDIFHVIFKYKLVVTLIFLSVVCVATLITFIMPKVYEADAKVMVKFGRENVYTPTTPTMRENQPVLFDYSREERINSEVEILNGRNLIEKVISDLGAKKIYPDLDKKPLFVNPFAEKLGPVEEENELFTQTTLMFMENLTVEAVRKSNIIDIKYQHNDPIIAAQVVNKLIDVFLEFHLNVYKKSHGYEFFDDQVAILKEKLETSENEYESFCRENNITSLTEQKSLLLQAISSLRADHARTLSEISEREGKRRALKGQSAADFSDASMGEETELNPLAISSIKSKLNELRLEEEELLSKFTPNSVPVTNIRNEINKAQELLQREEKIYHDKAITSISHNLSALQKRELVQNEQLSAYQQELERINGLELRLKELERKVRLNEETYQLYVKHMEEARLSQAMDTQKIANISVVEPALPPIEPILPNKLLNIALSLLLGVFAGILAPLYMEYMQHSFSNREDVVKYLDLPVMASVPEIE
ncbi:MAG TPA: GumC family protein [Deltaproteobacteria bacterium]|nr:GumC family protein [Deltaproteobacteria bacterium]HPR52031.1 GumC family protein [Deltaproteobacteria bacterium]